MIEVGTMQSIREICSAVSSCKKCDLHLYRKNAVCGTGPERAKYMIIGEAPGFQEDEKGIPFVGRSGKLLDNVLESLSIRRDEIFITNAVRCRPGMNRTPSTSEIKTCSDYLKSEIELISPSVIIPMGNVALRSLGYIFRKKFPKISQVSGKVIKIGEYLIHPQFHPAAILRNPKKKVYFIEGLRRVFTNSGSPEDETGLHYVEI